MPQMLSSSLRNLHTIMCRQCNSPAAVSICATCAMYTRRHGNNTCMIQHRCHWREHQLDLSHVRPMPPQPALQRQHVSPPGDESTGMPPENSCLPKSRVVLQPSCGLADTCRGDPAGECAAPFTSGNTTYGRPTITNTLNRDVISAYTPSTCLPVGGAPGCGPRSHQAAATGQLPEASVAAAT